MDSELLVKKLLDEVDKTQSKICCLLEYNKFLEFCVSFPPRLKASFAEVGQRDFSFPVILITNELGTLKRDLRITMSQPNHMFITIDVPTELRDMQGSTFAVDYPVKVFYRWSIDGTLVLDLSLSYVPFTFPSLPPSVRALKIVKRLDSNDQSTGWSVIKTQMENVHSLVHHAPDYLKNKLIAGDAIAFEVDAGVEVDGEKRFVYGSLQLSPRRGYPETMRQLILYLRNHVSFRRELYRHRKNMHFSFTWEFGVLRLKIQ